MNHPNTTIDRIRSTRDFCDFWVFGRPDAGKPFLAMLVVIVVGWPDEKPPIAPFRSDDPEAALRFSVEQVALFLWADLKAASAPKSRFIVRTHKGEAYTITKFTPKPPRSEKPRQSQKTTSTALIYLHTPTPRQGAWSKKPSEPAKTPKTAQLSHFFAGILRKTYGKTQKSA